MVVWSDTSLLLLHYVKAQVCVHESPGREIAPGPHNLQNVLVLDTTTQLQRSFCSVFCSVYGCAVSCSSGAASLDEERAAGAGTAAAPPSQCQDTGECRCAMTTKMESLVEF